MEQLTSSKLEKEYDKVIYCHPVYFAYIQRMSCKIMGWMNPKLESRSSAEISTDLDMQMTPLSWKKLKRN